MNFKICIFLFGSFGIVAMMGTKPDEPSKSPPYELIFDRFEVYNNTEKMFTNVSLRVKKYNRTTYVLNGEFQTIRDLTDDFSAIFQAWSESGNEFKLIHSSRGDNICSFLIDNEVVYPELVEFSNLPKIAPDMCPISKGKFAIKDYYITDSRLPEKLPSGDKWKINIIVLEKGEVSAAISIYIVVERKKHKM